MRPSFQCRRRFHAGTHRRGVSPVIATVLLLSITIVLLGLLYAFIRLPLSPAPPNLTYASNYNQTSVTVYQEGNNPPSLNCPGASGTCVIPGETFVVSTLSGSVPYSFVQVQFFCNGVLTQSGALTSIMNPATSPGPGASASHSSLCPGQSGTSAVCQNWPAAWASLGLIDLVYFEPLKSGSSSFGAGDTFYVYSSVCNLKIGSGGTGEYYGPPTECITGVAKCYIQLLYTGNPNAIIGTFQLAG